MAKQTIVGQHESLAGRLLRLPLGELAIGIFLWLVTVAALYGVLLLLVLRPSLGFPSTSVPPSASEKSDTTGGLAGASCYFPTTED
jgi:hypothetical protein